MFRAPEGLVYLRTSRTGHHVFLREADGQEMVLLPTGIARRGMQQAPHGPQHVVRLSACLMDRSEVTCAQYSVFLQRMRRADDPSLRHPEDPGVELRPSNWTGDASPKGWEPLPVTGLSWYAAYAYARWVGGRLPTEAEWERAAGGPLGHAYPWGDVFVWENCHSGSTMPVPARSARHGASPYGLLHMSGNAREWCEDRFDPHWYTRCSRTNPRGPSRNQHRVVRGGSFATAPETLRVQFRDHAPPTVKNKDIGFRVVVRWPRLAPLEAK